MGHPVQFVPTVHPSTDGTLVFMMPTDFLRPLNLPATDYVLFFSSGERFRRDLENLSVKSRELLNLFPNYRRSSKVCLSGNYVPFDRW